MSRAGDIKAAPTIRQELKIRKASRRDHKRLVELARLSKFTRDFSNTQMFSSDNAYEKGWIRVATLGKDIVAMTCVRHKVREPATVLYFLIVHPTVRGHGIGAVMLEDLESQTPHNLIKFNVNHQNPDARRFYARHGYRVTRQDALHGTCWEMEKSW